MNTLNGNVTQQMRLADLVRAAQTGDREAFGTLVLRFERAVFGAALRRLRDHSEAQELTQEVFVKAFQKINQLRVPECFGGWLRSITDRMAINRAVRRDPAMATEPSALETTCVDTKTPITVVLEAERQVQLRAGLARLRELDRETLDAFYMRGQSLRQMSDEFDAPVGTIKRRLHVARQRLAKEVEALAAV